MKIYDWSYECKIFLIGTLHLISTCLTLLIMHKVCVSKYPHISIKALIVSVQLLYHAMAWEQKISVDIHFNLSQ